VMTTSPVAASIDVVGANAVIGHVLALISETGDQSLHPQMFFDLN